LLDQFVSSFACADVLSILKFNADCIIDFSTRILINRFNRLDTFSLSSIYIINELPIAAKFVAAMDQAQATGRLIDKLSKKMT
jgi:hypothetical protein